ncbi:lasso peptide isopeptide bond-forming cyclase [Aestuariibacter sp. GS-14]|uniref:lasso peptide isopeptide bond-forming cyclase n=1 Tax=Aestuariibacter sp. GS-14 TaxID=2590670 RepID=UPI00112C2144|nr:lasso peptide isopeptide bond-forming cyclase [Aestuariibacter sp. GS-14]TPV53883.1 lasso peptide isopeptide bond-forming cyclase [Aestuariibacter sp. GS-14]
MTALFAMVAADHHAILDLFDEASRHTNLALSWQNSHCLVGSYCSRGSARDQSLSQFSLPNGNVIASVTAPLSNSELSSQFDKQPAGISNVITGPHTVFTWHNTHKKLYASRDALNQHVLYYGNVDGVTVISSEASFIAKLMPKRPTLNTTALACWLAGQPNPGLCLYNEIHTLPLGQSIEVSPAGKVHLHIFWDIDPHNKLILGSDSEYREAFLALLRGCVSSHIHPSDSLVVSQMSGGMDSTSITALVNELLKSPRACRALSHLYSHSASCDESANIKAMYAKLNLVDPIQVTVDAGAHRDFLSLYPTDFDSPGTVLSPRYHQECDLIRAAGGHRLLTGNGGDEMCWGHASAYTERLWAGEFGVIAEVLKACKQTGMARWPVARSLFVKPLIPQWLLNTAYKLKGYSPSNIPPWLTPQAAKAATDASQIANPFNQRKQPVNYARYHAMKTTSTYNSVRSYQKVGWQYGINVAHPFFDARMAEFSFAVPGKQLIRGPYPKWLLRNAMQHHLPESVCWNVKKVTFDNHFGQLVKDNAEPLRELLNDTRLAELGLVNNAVLLKAFDAALSGNGVSMHVDLLYAILTQRWIQQHH